MSPASLTWLDHSEADRRRAREIVSMFLQPGVVTSWDSA